MIVELPSQDESRRARIHRFASRAILAVVLTAECVLGAQDATEPNDLAMKRIGSFVANYCFECHDSLTAKADLDLEALDPLSNHSATFEVWRAIFEKTSTEEMPPNNGRALLPSNAERAEFVSALESELIRVDRDRIATEGRSQARRLNRFEYEDALRVLLNAPWLRVADELPADGVFHLFNKSTEGLDVSHVQLSKYLDVGRDAVRLAANTAAHPPTTRRFHARDEPVVTRYLRWRPGLQTAATRASIPLLGHTSQTNIIRDLEPLTVGASDPTTRELEAMGVFSGAHPATTKYDFTRLDLPIDGRYRVRLKTYTFRAGPNGASGGNDHGLTGGRKAWWRPDRNVVLPGARSEPVTLYALKPSGDTRWLTTFDSRPEPTIVEREVVLESNDHIRPDASRLVRTRPGWKGNPNATPEGVPGFAMNWLEIEGPLHNQWPPESYQSVFGDLPFDVTNGVVAAQSTNPTTDARELIANFARRAFRGRPVSDDALNRYMDIFHQARDLDANFSEAMNHALSAILVSPEFLFIEPPSGPSDDIGIANRLSFFLWNQPPDETLLQSKDLANPSTLRRQTERLLRDDRSKRFVRLFLDYWLDLRNLNDTAPDATLYPDYYLDSLLHESALRETRSFVQRLIQQNLPTRYLIDADFTYVNERLASHYKVAPAIQSVSLRPINLPESSPRGGLLTQTSILKVTANGTTTSPVLRGVWLVERILGIDIPAPPSGVEAIEPDTRGATTIREQLAAHTEVTSCAKCHEKFDPVGFALESFDVMGGYREKYRALGDIGEKAEGLGKNGHAFTFRYARPVECDATLASGEPFTNIQELKQLLLRDERAIARNVFQRLIVYATGAPVAFSERDEMETILDSLAPDYQLRDLIHAVTQSSLFLN